MYTINSTDCREDALNRMLSALPELRIRIIEPLKSLFNFSFGYARIVQRKYCYILVDNEELLAEFLDKIDKGYIFGTENITGCSDDKYNFTIWSDVPLNLNMELFFKYGLCNGITISKFDGDIIELYAVIADKSDEIAKSFFRRNKDVVMEPVYNFDKQKGLFIPSGFSKQDYFELKCGFDPSIPPVLGYEGENLKVQVFLDSTYDKLSMETDNGPVKLTQREMEICFFLAEGQQVKHIARRMEISPGTVANHIESIKRKTGASTATRVVRFYLNTMSRRKSVA